MIKATKTLDETELSVTFDATPWFEIATDEQLKAMKLKNWADDDHVYYLAWYCWQSDPKLKKLSRCADLIAELRDRDETFTVEVDPVDARIWIAQHRKHLMNPADYDQLACPKCGSLRLQTQVTYNVGIDNWANCVCDSLDAAEPWNPDAEATCDDCHFKGVLFDFMTLEDLRKATANEEAEV